MKHFGIIALVLSLICQLAPAQDRSNSAAMAAEARRILANARLSSYNHKTRVDESKGLYELDCSGLAVRILKNVDQAALKAVPYTKRSSRPLASDFYAVFHDAPAGQKSGAHWQKIQRAMDAKPGDFIAWRKSEIPEKGNTGHVMIIESAPVMDNGQVKVVIIDSTGSPHADDTRIDGATGVGRGTIWFQIDGEGRAVSYRSSPAKGTTKTMLIEIGRALSAK